MAAFFNGHINSVPQETISDLKTLLEYVKAQKPDKKVAEAAANLENYIDNYEFMENEERYA